MPTTRPSRRAASNVALFDEILDPEYFTPDETLQPKPIESSLPLPPELRGLVFQHCDVSTIQQLRLVNRQTEADASYHLFSTLTVAMQKRQLRRLQRIARVPKFAKGVKVLVWETAQYSAKEEGVDLCTAESIGKLHYRQLAAKMMEEDPTLGRHDVDEWYDLTDAEQEPWNQSASVGLARYKSLQKSEENLLADLEVHSVVSKHIAALSNLRSVTMTPWAEKRNRSFFDVGALTGDSKLMPPPFLAGEDETAARTLQNKAMMLTDFGILDGGLKIEQFHLVPNYKAVLEPHARYYQLPSIMVEFDTLMFARQVYGYHGDRVGKRYNALKDLHIDLSWVGYRCTLSTSLFGLDGSCPYVLEFFGSLAIANVETLSLSVCKQAPAVRQGSKTTVITLGEVLRGRQFPSLRELRITDMWLEPVEICDFVLAHADTLEVVKLVNINLGDRAGVDQYLGLVNIPAHPSQAPLDESEREGWKQVVKTCKVLPKWEGLGIAGATVGKDWKVVSEDDFEQIKSDESEDVDMQYGVKF
ncbi:hypothetical protein LTR17_001256 [Elasticomyces elasticus]|nr:hypothetical protein LTR17_001256 [Elasticomyces elasticus]